MGASGFSIDIILFGMIAAFLVFRLRSILGRRTGFERPPQAVQPQAAPQPAARSGAVMDAKVEPPVTRAVPDPASPLGQTLAQMRTIDRAFDPVAFLNGAEQAFRLIVTGFAKGDRGLLRTLLSDEMYQAFDNAITDRDKAGHTQVSEVRTIESASIEAAEMHGTVASLTARIVSDQISLTKDSAGHIIVGAEAVTEITDLWTFERDLARQDPTWRLTAARSA